MLSGTQGVNAEMGAHYLFGNFGWIVDVGGGIGTLLLPILERHPSAKGQLRSSEFDRLGSLTGGEVNPILSDDLSNRFQSCPTEGNPKSPSPGIAKFVAMSTGHNILAFPSACL